MGVVIFVLVIMSSFGIDYCLQYAWLYFKAKRLGGFLYIHIPFNIQPNNLYIGPFTTYEEREKWVRDYNAPIAALTEMLKSAYDFPLDACAERVDFTKVNFKVVEKLTPGEATSTIRRAFAGTLLKEAVFD